MIFKLIIEGISYGLFLAILVGPLLMSLIDVSLKYGVKKGMFLALGIWISDFIIIGILFYYDYKTEINLTEGILKWLAYLASLTFLIVGILYILKARNHERASRFNTPNQIRWMIIKGFLINTINPFTFVFWTTLAASHMVINEYKMGENIWFFSSIFFVILITDTLKVLLAHKVSPYLTSNGIKYIKYFSGIIFILTAFFILTKSSY